MLSPSASRGLLETQHARREVCQRALHALLQPRDALLQRGERLGLRTRSTASLAKRHLKRLHARSGSSNLGRNAGASQRSH